MKQNNHLEELYSQHYDLCGNLWQLEHKRWLADLPEGYQLSGGPASAGYKKIYLTPLQRTELEAEYLYTRLNILKLAKEIHALRFESIPAWIEEGIKQVRESIQTLTIATEAPQ